MKLTPLIFANAAAFTGAILWVVCVLVAMVLPDLYQAGADLLALGGSLGHFNVSLNSAVFGGVLFAGIAWVSGYLFGWNLEKLSKK